jgi:hypothetical protein
MLCQDYRRRKMAEIAISYGHPSRPRTARQVKSLLSAT